MSTTTTESGLQTEEIRVGNGAEAQAGQFVSVHYTGWLTDGTKFDMFDQNLLAEYHIRYGGIAYHHVADNYVALFSHFIPCGVWEAVYIIEGL